MKKFLESCGKYFLHADVAYLLVVEELKKYDLDSRDLKFITQISIFNIYVLKIWVDGEMVITADC